MARRRGILMRGPKEEGYALPETERVWAEAGEHRAGEAEERTRPAVAARPDAQRESEAELDALQETLNRERTERAKAVSDAERRVQEAEERARQAEGDVKRQVREAIVAAEERARTEAENRLGAEIEKARTEAERRASEAAAKARQEAEREAREAMGAREQDLREESSRLEHELNLTSRQLEEAQDRAAAAEQRLREVEAEADEKATAAVAAERKEVTEPRSEHPPEEPPEDSPEEAAEEPPRTGEVMNLNSASFEQLREIGMSITQAKRVIAYRDRHGFGSVDDLDELPGFPRAFLAEVKGKVSL